jgi:perosamine synthetase
VLKLKLALEGGEPVRKRPFPSYSAVIDDREVNAVVKVLKSGRLRRGPQVEEFEGKLAKYFNVKHAVAVFNGTVALHVAVAALDLGPGDEMIVPTYTFVASPNAALYQCAVPIFSDIHPSYYNIDPSGLEKLISDKTKGIMVVHMHGHPGDMDPIMEIAEKHGLWVVEDNAQSSGATYKGKLVGTFGAASTFSLVEGKIMVTGEGGFCLTNDDKIAEKMGRIQNFFRLKPTSNIHNFYGIGYNYRMTEMQAAMGIVQLERLDDMVAKRRRNAEYLTRHIKKIEGVYPPMEMPWAKHVYYVYLLRVDTAKLGVSTDQFKAALTAEGIPITPERSTALCHLTDLYKRKIGYGKTSVPFKCDFYDKDIEYREGQCPVAESIAKEVFWLTDALVVLEREDLDDIIAAIEKITIAYLKRKKR